MEPMYLSIQPKKTGERIRKLLLEKGYTIREIQGAFGFENPQAIYKWLSGKSLPSIDNFIILSRLLHTSIEDILVIDGDISYYIGNFIFYVIKASGGCALRRIMKMSQATATGARMCFAHSLFFLWSFKLLVE